MRDTPQLEPETKERWAGIRSAESMVSQLQNDINALRSRVSGIRRYQGFLDTLLSNNDGFSKYEADLKSRADGRSVISDEQVSDARDTVDTAFASFSDFAGDPSQDTGVFGLSDYDAYRGYLTTNGVAQIDADQHIQVIQELFTPGDVFLDASLDFSSFDELEQWLVDNGWTAEEAAEFVQKLADKYGSYADYLNALQNDVNTIEELLNEINHSSGGPGGGPRVERRDGDLYLFGEEIRLQQLQADSITTPGPSGDLSWSLDTQSKAVDIDTPVFINATASTGASGDFGASVSLVINGEVADRSVVQVSNGSATVSFEVTFDSPGEYDVVIGNSSPITLTVELAV